MSGVLSLFTDYLKHSCEIELSVPDWQDHNGNGKLQWLVMPFPILFTMVYWGIKRNKNFRYLVKGKPWIFWNHWGKRALNDCNATKCRLGGDHGVSQCSDNSQECPGGLPVAVTTGRAQRYLEMLRVHRIKHHRSHIPQEIQKTDCSVILISLVLIKFFSQWNLSKQLLLMVL